MRSRSKQAQDLQVGDIISLDGVEVVVGSVQDVTEAVDITVYGRKGRPHTIRDLDRDKLFPLVSNRGED